MEEIYANVRDGNLDKNLYDKTFKSGGLAYVKQFSEQQACDLLIQSIQTKTYCDDDFKNQFISNCTTENLKLFYTFVGACTIHTLGVHWVKKSIFASDQDYYSGTVNGNKVMLNLTSDNEYGKTYEGEIDNKNQDSVTMKIESHQQKDYYRVNINGHNGTIEHHKSSSSSFYTTKIDCVKTCYSFDRSIFYHGENKDFEPIQPSHPKEDINCNVLPYAGISNSKDIQLLLLSKIFKQENLPTYYDDLKSDLDKSYFACTRDAYDKSYSAIASEIKPHLPIMSDFLYLTNPQGQELNIDSRGVSKSLYFYPIYEYDFDGYSYYIDAISGKILNNVEFKLGKKFNEQRNIYRNNDKKSLPFRIIYSVLNLCGSLYLFSSLIMAFINYFDHHSDASYRELMLLPIIFSSMFLIGSICLLAIIYKRIKLGPIESKFIHYAKKHPDMSSDIKIKEFCPHVFPYYFVAFSLLVIHIGEIMAGLYVCSSFCSINAFTIIFSLII